MLEKGSSPLFVPRRATTSKDFLLRIFFVINALEPGGAEKVASLLINSFASHHEVVIVSRRPENSFFYKINPKVRNVQISSENDSSSLVRTVKYIWNLKNLISRERPDLIISFLTEVNILSLIAFLLSRFLNFNFKSRISISERTDPSRHRPRRIVRFLRFLTYRFSSKLVLQTPGIVPWGTKLVDKNKICVIPNPVDLEELKNNSRPGFVPESKDYILHVGRFTPEKGQAMLFEAFAEVGDKIPNTNLIFIGEGPEKEKLQKLVNGGKFSKRVIFLNNQRNIYDYLCHAKLFVLCSHYEGFPNVLMEALASGTPSISFDCKSGPSELLNGEMAKYLVPVFDVHALAEKILEVLEDSELKNKFADYSFYINKEFSTMNIAKKWLE